VSTKVDLPDGAWALLRDPAKVPERLRRPVTNLAAKLHPEIAAAKEAGTDGPDLTADVLGGFQALNDLVMVAVVADWSFDLAVTPETVGDLPGDAYDVLRRETAKCVTDLIPDFSPNPDPASPTPPSGA
jgi:hypothetical protein